MKITCVKAAVRHLKGYGLDTDDFIRQKATKRSKDKYFCVSRNFLFNKKGRNHTHLDELIQPFTGVELTYS